MNTPNDQYITPSFYTAESELAPATAEFEKSQEWGDFITSIERSIDSFRDQADETTIARYENRSKMKNFVSKAFTLPLSKEAVRNQLINKEAVIGGEMIEPKKSKEASIGETALAQDTKKVTSRLFWYHGNHEWFYQVSEASRATGFTASTAKYQIQHNELRKSVGATPIMMSEQEIEAFTIWAQQYHAVLARGLYKDLDDSTIDDQLDYLIQTKDIKGSLAKDDYRLAA